MADNTILVGGQPIAELRDVAASGVVTPGDLLEYGGATDSLQRHSGAATKSQVIVADIVPHSGDPSDNTSPIDDDYADGEYMKAFVPNPANRVRMTITAEESVTPGTALVSNGDGHLREYDSVGGDDMAAILFESRETVSTGVGETARVVVERV